MECQFERASFSACVPVIGLFYDVTGSYYPAWIVMGILAVLMTVSLLYSYQKSREYVK